MRRVILESPYGQDPYLGVVYGRACLRHSLWMGEAPMAMHLLYTQPGILDDSVPAERAQGMASAFLWYGAAEACVVYRDYGISDGMEAGIEMATSLGLPVEYRSLPYEFRIMHRDQYYDAFPATDKMTAAELIENANRRG